MFLLQGISQSSRTWSQALDRIFHTSFIHPGTIAGAVIGTITGLALLIAGAWYCILRWKRKQRAPAPPTDPEPSREVLQSGRRLLPELLAKHGNAELGVELRGRHELPATNVASELSSNHC